MPMRSTWRMKFISSALHGNDYKIDSFDYFAVYCLILLLLGLHYKLQVLAYNCSCPPGTSTPFLVRNIVPYYVHTLNKIFVFQVADMGFLRVYPTRGFLLTTGCRELTSLSYGVLLQLWSTTEMMEGI